MDLEELEELSKGKEDSSLGCALTVVTSLLFLVLRSPSGSKRGVKQLQGFLGLWRREEGRI